jgi:hypothetical protein
MLKNASFSESYRSALRVAMISSLVIGVLGALALDRETPRLTAIALALNWVFIVAVIVRRPQNPTPSDLFLIRWRCLPFVIGFQVAMHYVWHLRGLE